MADRLQPPTAHEVELSLFGPGVGECVVVHAGDGDWVVVDSCVETTTGRPIALRYLEDLGIDPAGAVRLIVVSHWHDDHIRGLAPVVAAASGAAVACSAALNHKEFFTLVAAGERAMTESPGTAEFGRVLDLLAARSPAGVRPASIGPIWATADRRLWWRSGGAGVAAEAWALSPSSASFTLAQRALAALLPRPGTPKRRLVSPMPNEAAVVVWIEVGPLRLLLGSDLVASSNPLTGWQAIVQSTTRPAGTAHVFKVPHHGAASADDPAVWSTMLEPSPQAALTPFNRGRFLPTDADVARLRGRTPHGYCTARRGGWSPPRLDAAVERTLKETVRARRMVTGPMGHVRVRADIHAPHMLRVDLFEGAHRL